MPAPGWLMVRANPDIVLENGQETVDFCTMYTSFPFRSMIDRTIAAVDEAWDFVTQQGDSGMDVDGASPELTLGPKGGPSWEMATLEPKSQNC